MFDKEEFKVFLRSSSCRQPTKVTSNVILEEYVESLCEFTTPTYILLNKNRTVSNAYLKRNFKIENKPHSVMVSRWFLFKFGYNFCSICKQPLLAECFHSNSSRWNNLNNECKNCISALNKGLHRKNIRKKNATNRYISKIAATYPQFKEEINEIYEDCPEGYQVDHIVPLRGRYVCGLHVPQNLTYLTPEENFKKNNKHSSDNEQIPLTPREYSDIIITLKQKLNKGEIQMTKSNPIFLVRQGDVLVMAVDAIPEGLREVARDNGRVVLAYGEVTGHAHALHDAGVMLLERPTGDDNERFMTVEKNSQLVHEEHSTIEIPAGTYKVIRQREYTEEGFRQVAD